MPAVWRRAQGSVRVPAVRHARVSQAALLPPAPGRRGRTGQCTVHVLQGASRSEYFIIRNKVPLSEQILPNSKYPAP